MVKVKEQILWQWKWIEYLAYAIVFITPLYFSTNHWFSFNSPKTLAISFGVLSMTILYAWGVIVSKKFSIKVTPLHIVLGVFLVILTISSILGVDAHNSFFGTFSFPTNLIFIYIVSLFAIFIGFLIHRDKQFLPKIILTSFLSSIIVAFFSYTGTSIFKIFTDYSSTIGNSSYAGAYLLFNICFGIGLFSYYKKCWKKILIAISTLFIIFCPLFFNIDIFSGKIALSDILHNPLLLAGVANGAALGVIFSIIIIACFYLLLSCKKPIKIIGVVLFLGFLLGTVYTGYIFLNPTSKIHNIYSEVKGDNRFIAWDIAERGLMDRPLLGSGFNNFYYTYQKYFRADIYKEDIEFFLQPHNVVFEYASNNGILGLVSFLSLLFFTFLALFKYREDEDGEYRMFRISIIGILFGYFIQNLFGFDTVTSYLMLFLVVGIAIGLSYKNRDIAFTDKSEIIKKIISVIIILGSLVSIVLFVVLPWKESLKWRHFNQETRLQELSILRQGLQETSLFGGVGDSTYEAIKLYNFYIANVDKINDSNRMSFLDEIDSIVGQIEKDQLSQPDDFRAYLVIGKLLSLKIYIMGRVDESVWGKANFYLDKTLSIVNYQNPEAFLAKAQLYIFKNDYVQARLYTQKAISLIPNYKDSYEIAKKIQALSSDKDFQKYIDNMQKIWLIK